MVGGADGISKPDKRFLHATGISSSSSSDTERPESFVSGVVKRDEVSSSPWRIEQSFGPRDAGPCI